MSVLQMLLESETKDAIKERASKHAEGTIILTTVPQADRVIVIGSGGERVLEPTSNVVSILFSSTDQKSEIKKAGYKKAIVDLPVDISHGSKIQKDIVLERN